VTIRVGESGKPLRYATYVDMEDFTELKLEFTAPTGGTSFTRTNASSPPVGLGPKVVDDDLGVINANEYMEYTFQASDFAVAGTWSVRGTYTDTVADPDDIFIGPDVEFEVLE
jgi:hypothetical protein